MKSLMTVLDGKGRTNDAPAIRTLLEGGCAFDLRDGGVIAAPTLRDLPPGLYQLTSRRHAADPPPRR